MSWLVKTLIKFRTNASGATLVEYGLAIAMAAAVGTIGFALLGGIINAEVNSASAIMNN